VNIEATRFNSMRAPANSSAMGTIPALARRNICQLLVLLTGTSAGKKLTAFFVKPGVVKRTGRKRPAIKFKRKPVFPPPAIIFAKSSYSVSYIESFMGVSDISLSFTFSNSLYNKELEV
jgi:hypothetical protein